MTQGSPVVLESTNGTIQKSAYRYDAHTAPVVVLVKKFDASSTAHQDFLNEVKGVLKTSHLPSVPNLIAVNVSLPVIVYGFNSEVTIKNYVL